MPTWIRPTRSYFAVLVSVARSKKSPSIIFTAEIDELKRGVSKPASSLVRLAERVVFTKYLSPPACGASGMETSAAPVPRGTFSALLPTNACGLFVGKTVAAPIANFLPVASVAKISEMQLISAASAQTGSTAR